MAIVDKSFWESMKEKDNFIFNAKVENITKNIDLTNEIETIAFSYNQKSQTIRSMTGTFKLSDLGLVETGDNVKVTIIHNTKSFILLDGKAKVTNRTLKASQIIDLQIDVIDEINNLLGSVIQKDTFLFDQFLLNITNLNNSLIYQAFDELGINHSEVEYIDVRDSQSRLIEVPFMIFKQGDRWIDLFETMLSAVKISAMLDSDGKIVFKGGLFQNSLIADYTYDSSNILSQINQSFSYPENNGIRQTYDRYTFGENQVVYQLEKKVEVPIGTSSANQHTSMRITYSTSIITQYGLTEAKGYYFDASSNKIDVTLTEGIHYDFVEFNEAQTVVKFYNPYTTSPLFIESFEIKGVPVNKHSDNEVNVVEDGLLEDEWNIINSNKNDFIQTEELAKDVAEYEYREKCLLTRTLSFKALFSPFLYNNALIEIKIDDLDVLALVTDVRHSISKTSGFYTEITAKEIHLATQTFQYKTIETESHNNQYLVELNNIKDELENIEVDLPEDLEDNIKKLNAQGFIQEDEPTAAEGLSEYDVWYKPSTKVFKVWKNGTWQAAMDSDIPPTVKTSILARAGVFSIGKTDTEAGIFFTVDEDTNNPIFTSKYTSTLAQITIDSQAGILLKNGNNIITLNMKDPLNPAQQRSQILLNVQNVDDPKHQNTVFQVGEENTGNFIRLTKGGAFTQYIGNEDISVIPQRLNNGSFTISSNTDVIGTLSVYGGQGIISANGTNDANSTKRIVIDSGQLLFQEKSP